MMFHSELTSSEGKESVIFTGFQALYKKLDEKEIFELLKN